MNQDFVEVFLCICVSCYSQVALLTLKMSYILGCRTKFSRAYERARAPMRMAWFRLFIHFGFYIMMIFLQEITNVDGGGHLDDLLAMNFRFKSLW